jgi:hypothetical protein
MNVLFVKYCAIIKFIRMLLKLFILYNAVSVCVVLYFNIILLTSSYYSDVMHERLAKQKIFAVKFIFANCSA